MKNVVAGIFVIVILLVIFSTGNTNESSRSRLASHNVSVSEVEDVTETHMNVLTDLYGDRNTFDNQQLIYRYSGVHNNILEDDKLHDFYSVKVDFDFVVEDRKVIYVFDPTFEYLPRTDVKVKQLIDISHTLNDNKVVISTRVKYEAERENTFYRDIDMITVSINLNKMMGEL